MAFTPLLTSRLKLRQLSKDDLAEILFLRGDAGMNTFIKRKRPETLEDAMSFYTRIERETSENKIHYWSLSHLDDSKMIGSICLWNFSEDRKQAEIGYDLHPSKRGLGLMNEAMGAVLRFGFVDLGVQCIEAWTHRENLPSLRLLEKNGFHLMADRVDNGNEDNVILACKAPEY